MFKILIINKIYNYQQFMAQYLYNRYYFIFVFFDK